MRHTKLALCLSTALICLPGTAAADHSSSRDFEGYYSPSFSSTKDYWTFDFGASSSDLDAKGAVIKAGYHRQYSEQLFGLGVGGSVSTSLTSMRTEGAAPGGEDLTLRYTALTGYVSSRIPLIALEGYRKVSLEARLGGSGLKSSGTAAELLYDEYDFGAYYGASLIYSPLKDFQLTVSYDMHDAFDVSDISAGFRVQF